MQLSDIIWISFSRIKEIKDYSLLSQLLSLLNTSIDTGKISKQIYKEGSMDPLSILRFHDEINSLRKELLAYQLDFEDEIGRKEWEIQIAIDPASADGPWLDPFPHPEPDLYELHERETALLYEKEALMRLPANVPSERSLEEIDEELDRIESVLEEHRRKINLEEDLKDLGDARIAFRGIIKKISMISESSSAFLNDSPYSLFKERWDKDLRFADLVDVVYDLFRDIFIDGLTRWQLLLAMNCQGEPINIVKPDGNILYAAVLIHTIVYTYNAVETRPNKNVEEWGASVLPRFGITKEDYSDRGSEVKKLKGVRKKRINDLKEYIRGLNSLKHKLPEIVSTDG